jgi:TonB family protein
MNIDSLTKKFDALCVSIKTRYWPKLVTELETKSLRSLFLWALLIGFILSVPWQCTRLVYNAYFSEDQTVQQDHGASLISPDRNSGSITKMPNPRARRSIPQAEVQNTAAENKPSDENHPVQAETTPASSQNQEAKVIYQEAPKYPIEALRNNYSGTVQLRVSIDADGNPSNIDIEVSSGNRYLDRSAKTAVSQWRFSPKIINSTKVNSEILIPVEFKAEQ